MLMSSPMSGQKRKPLKALAVDDDDLVLSVMVQSLEELGFDTISALGGRNALAMLESGEPIDLLVTDVRMPRVSGMEVASAVRRKSQSLPIIFVTGFSAHLVDANENPDPHIALLRKPYTLAALKKTVSTIMSGSPATPAFA